MISKWLENGGGLSSRSVITYLRVPENLAAYRASMTTSEIIEDFFEKLDLGVRWNDTLKTNCLPDAQVKLSPKRWINSELFLERFQCFTGSIPAARPVVLFMDSHASHINPEVIFLAKANDIFLFTFPSHKSHILQPLDVYRSLKSLKSLKDYMEHHPEKSNRTNFHEILNPAFILSFYHNNITNARRNMPAQP
ncbi:hypothetical protein HHI36_023644 [Cryptolaemus montrouzieri]|uniref:DDE-1 domain-containing protein n=1 Tax=Cryptolaemus montrouzieri TaxID=559131 RepID=A0ABD2PJA4_9CUCU